MKITASTAILAAGLILAGEIQAFGGGIAIGMARLNDDAGLNVSFSARAKLETEEYDIDETIYYRPGKLREEMNVAGQDMVTIQRHDLGKMWMLMAQGFYMEHPIDAPSEQTKSFRLIEHEQVGTETVNGTETAKYRTIWETDDGRYGGMSWLTDDGIVLKAFLVSETGGEKQRIRFQITELTRGEQPQSLFELPEGYTKMGGAGGLFGGQRGGPPGGDEQRRGVGDRLRGLFNRN